jgi:hypothetical protein
MENSLFNRIPFKNLLSEMQEADKEYTKKYFRQKVIRIYMKCLKSNRINLAVKIAEKYRKELTEPLRSDLFIAEQYSLFVKNLFKNQP